MNNWFVFHVQTGKEDIVCELLNRLLEKEESSAFVPQVEMIFKSSKFVCKELKPMFPGYVFTESDKDEISFMRLAYKYVRFFKCIFDLLGSENINYAKVQEDEKEFLLGFCNQEYIIKDSKGIIVGDKVFITSGPLQGRESIIKKIDRHKRRAEIELIYFGDKRRISVALDIVSKMK